MGLDITAYQEITRSTRTQKDLEREYEEVTPAPGHIRVVSLYANEDFTPQADGITTGYYLSKGKEIKFRAGSYGGYNQWRRRLAQMLGRTDQEVFRNPTGPFAELISFSDCEGVIGPVTSKKLAQDFLDHRHLVPDYGPDFTRLYDQFSEAFHLAANHGAVEFH